MLLLKIKNLLFFFTGKKNGQVGYLKSDLQLHDLPGQNSRQGNQYSRRKGIISVLRQLFSRKQRVNHRTYQVPVSRKKHIIKLIGLGSMTITVLVFIFIGGWQLIIGNFESLPFFQVSEIVFSGTGTISKEKLREASGIILYQTSLIGLNCAQMEADLNTVPWVAQAEVKRNWPSTVEITIVENVPLALLHNKGSSGTQLQYIDRKGVPFLHVKPGADIDFPVITGLTEIDEPALKKKALAEVLIFLKKVNGNNPHLPAQSVSEIHLNRAGEMVVYLVEYPFPIFFGESNTRQKYLRLVQVLKTLYKKQNGKGSISEIDYIQMDYLDDKVLVSQTESG